MRKKLFLLAGLLWTVNIYAQNKKLVIETNDKNTRVKIGRSQNISIQEADGATRIRLGSTEINIADDNVHIDFWKARNNKKFRGNWAGIEMGINGYTKQNYNGYVQKDFMDLRPIKSINMRLNLMQLDFGLQKNKNNIGFLTGLGLESKDFRFENNYSIKNLEGTTQPKILEYDRVKKSKLNILYITVPLIFEIQSLAKNGKKIHAGVGVEGGWRIGSHTKIKYKDGSKWKKTKTRNNFNLNDFKADAQLRLGYGGFHLFVSYGLIDLFKKDKGPELSPITVGITLISF